MRTAPRSVKESYIFSRAYKKGKSAVTSHAALYLLPRKKGSGLTLGITVSKKLGGAVARNRVKRLVRESVRLILKEHPVERDASLIVVARARAFEDGVKMPEVKDKLARSMKELGLI